MTADDLYKSVDEFTVPMNSIAYDFVDNTGHDDFFILASPYSKFRAPAPATVPPPYWESGLYYDLLYAKNWAARITAEIIKLYDISIISPIVACHDVAVEGGINPLDVSIWLKIMAPIRKAAHGLIVAVDMDGWHSSVGTAHEIVEFYDAGKVVIIYKNNKETQLPELRFLSENGLRYFRHVVNLKSDPKDRLK
jgi:Domain of unknown function (DUF1937)